MSYLFSTPDDAGEPLLSEQHSSLADAVGAGMGSALTSVELAHHINRAAAGGLIGNDATLAGYVTPQTIAMDEQARAAIPDIPIEDARARVKQEGLDGQLKLSDQPSVKAPVLDLMISDAHERRDREQAIARGPSGFWPGALETVTSFGAGMVDPINLAAFSIPVLGEARGARLLARAGDSLLARGGVKALQGAAQGAVGTTALQPLDWWMHSEDGRDYTFADSLRSIALGAGMGAAFHAGFGGVGDALNRARGRPLKGSPEDLLQRGILHGTHVPGEALSGEPGGASGEPPGAAGTEPALESQGGVATPATSAGLPAAAPEAAASPGDMADWIQRSIDRPPYTAQVLADLPPAAHEDAVRAATADVIADRPVRAGEMLDIAADHDPRIAESFARADRQAVFDDVKQQLVATGMSETEADANATVFAARYATRAKRLGQGTALDAYRADGLDIRAGETGSAEGVGVFNQESERDPKLDDLTLTRTAIHQRDGYESHEFDIKDADGRRVAVAYMVPKNGGKTLDVATLVNVLGGGAYYNSIGSKGMRSLFPQIKKMYPEATQIMGFRSGGARPSGLPDEQYLAKYNLARDSFNQMPAAAHTFYSAVGRAIEGAKQDKASPEQWLGTLKNAAGVKPEEMKWLGLEDWLKQQKGSVSKADIADYIRANQIEIKEVTKGSPQNDADIGGRADDLGAADRAAQEINDRLIEKYGTLHNAFDRWTDDERDEFDEIHNEAAVAGLRSGFSSAEDPTKYHAYKLPGGENYRELLLTLPPKYASEADAASGNWTHTDEMGRPYAGEPYRSSHWDESNILAHVRFDDRVSDGKRTLHLAEVQSDWHQAGRQRGYKKPLTEEELATGRVATGVPDAPFKTTWPELAMKRMIRHAAENGYERISWDTGATNAERYDLSKHYDGISTMKKPNGNYQLTGKLKGEKDFKTLSDDVSPEGLADYVGKDMAAKIVEDGEGHYTGLDLRIGGEGMVGFYDKILPAAVDKLVKKYGGKVATKSLDHTSDIDKPFVVRDRDGNIVHRDVIGEDLAHELAVASGGRHEFDRSSAPPVHALDITPELRKASVEQGFPLFQNATPKADRRVGIPASAGEMVASHRTDETMKAHPDYKAAKAGDEHAALRMVEAVVDPASIEAARTRFGPDAIYAPVVAAEATGHNAIPHALAVLYADRAGGKVDDALVQANKAYHTGAGPMERLASPVHFAGDVVQGGKYVIVDDVSVMGSTVAAMADHIQKGGGEVAGVVSLVNASRTGAMKPPKAHVADIERRHGDVLRNELGIAPAALTADEAFYVRGFRDADALRTAIAASRRKREDRLAAKGVGRPEDGLGQQGVAGAGGPRGKVTIYGDNRAVVDLFKLRDKSTFMHEGSHIFLGELVRDAEKSEAIAADLQKVLDWFGVKSADEITLKQHEQWARGFEEYLREGRAPSSALAKVFDQFKQWLTQIYRSLSQLGPDHVPINDEIRGVMDRMLASDDEIAAHRGVDRAGAAADPRWKQFADAAPEHSTPEVLDASHAADLVPEPGSIAEPAKAVSAIEAEADKQMQWLKEMRDSMTPDEQAKIDGALKLLDEDQKAGEQILREGAACLLGALA